MDLWDVAKLIARRWVVSVPLLLLTAAALVWTGKEVTPNYTAEGSILLLPPTTEVSGGEGEERPVNPWTTDSLASAAITLLGNRSLHDRLAAEGFTGTWEAGRDPQFFSVIGVEVTAPTAGEAQATIQRLSEVVAAEVNARQQGLELTEGQLVGTVTLGAGENVAIARGNQMRALIVVFFAGVILTIGLTIGYDALLRARADRQAGFGGTAVRAATAAEPLAGQATAGARPANGARMEPIRPLAPTDAANHAQPSHQPAGISVSYRPASGLPPARPAEEAPPAPAPDPVLDDSTVVLPLSSLPSGRDRGRDRGDRDRDGDEDPAAGGAEHRWR